MPPARHYWGCREEDERRAGTKNADSETPSPFVVDRTKPHGVLGVKRENARRKRVPDHLPQLENDDKIVDGQQQGEGSRQPHGSEMLRAARQQQQRDGNYGS